MEYHRLYIGSIIDRVIIVDVDHIVNDPAVCCAPRMMRNWHDNVTSIDKCCSYVSQLRKCTFSMRIQVIIVARPLESWACIDREGIVWVAFSVVRGVFTGAYKTSQRR